MSENAKQLAEEEALRIEAELIHTDRIYSDFFYSSFPPIPRECQSKLDDIRSQAQTCTVSSSSFPNPPKAARINELMKANQSLKEKADRLRKMFGSSVDISALFHELDKMNPIWPELKVGDRVIRGPDWKWGDQDKGNQVGVVTRVMLSPTLYEDYCWVTVKWGHEEEEDQYQYRYYPGARDIKSVELLTDDDKISVKISTHYPSGLKALIKETQAPISSGPDGKPLWWETERLEAESRRQKVFALRNEVRRLVGAPSWRDEE